MNYKQQDEKYRLDVEKYLNHTFREIYNTFVPLKISTEDQDMTECADYIWGYLRISFRIRENDVHFRDFTIRYDKEWRKIKDGYGDIYLYLWKSNKDYMAIDMNKLRKTNVLNNPDDYPTIHNYDGKTKFKVIPIEDIQECFLDYKFSE